MEISEIECKSAVSDCGFEKGTFCINPYLGCGHSCVYCYARFMKRFTGIEKEWGEFVAVKTNIADVLRKQMRSKKFKGKFIFIGTVTDPYQPVEEKYRLTRKILEILLEHQNPVEILTKSDLVLRDLDLIKKFKTIDVNFTINTLDEKWKKLVEPNSSSIRERFDALEKLKKEGVKTYVMMGPYWPFFTDPDTLFKKFKEAGVSVAFTESFNTIGGNWVGVEEILKKHYPDILNKMNDIMFNKEKFEEFYNEAEKKVREASEKYNIPVTIMFARGHAMKSYK